MDPMHASHSGAPEDQTVTKHADVEGQPAWILRIVAALLGTVCLAVAFDSVASVAMDGADRAGGVSAIGRQLAGIELKREQVWQIAKATYSAKDWQDVYGEEFETGKDVIPDGWEREGRKCSASGDGGRIKARIWKHPKTGTMAVSFIYTGDLHGIVRGGAMRDQGTKVPWTQTLQFLYDKIDRQVEGESRCIRKRLGEKTKVRFVIGHGLGGRAAVSYYKQQQSKGTLGDNAEVLTVGSPPTGDESCTIPGRRWAHVNDPLASNIMSMEGVDEHELIEGKVFDDTSRRRRWKTYQRRRAATWKWTDDCERMSSDTFSNVNAVLGFNKNYSIMKEGKNTDDGN